MGKSKKLLKEISNSTTEMKLERLIQNDIISMNDVKNYFEYFAENYYEELCNKRFLETLVKLDYDFIIKDKDDKEIEMDVYKSSIYYHNNFNNYYERYYAINRGINPLKSPKLLIPINTFNNDFNFCNWEIKFEKNFIMFNVIKQLTEVIILRNHKEFMRVPRLKAIGINSGIDYARYLINIILPEHPLNFENQNFDINMQGRKIWFENQPAIIKRFIWNSNGEIIIQHEDENKYLSYFDYENKKNKNFIEKEVKISFLDKRINYFRN